MFRRGERGAIILTILLLASIAYEYATTGALSFPNWLFLLGIGGMCAQMLYRRLRP